MLRDGSRPCSSAPALRIGKGPASHRTDQHDYEAMPSHINHTSCLNKRESSERVEMSQEWPCALSEGPPLGRLILRAVCPQRQMKPQAPPGGTRERRQMSTPQNAPPSSVPGPCPVGQTWMSTEPASQRSRQNGEKYAEVSHTPPRQAARRRERHPRSVPRASASGRQGPSPTWKTTYLPRRGPGFARVTTSYIW